MSGVTGNEPINGRKNFEELYKKAVKLVEDFPGYKEACITGSYNSNKNKEVFGDIDIIVLIKGKNKKDVKEKLAEYLTSKSKTLVVPFISEKYKGKRYYNSGEIITISLNSLNKNIKAHQIDFILSLDNKELNFKKNFLNMPAEKQGIVLGLIKTALIENIPNEVFRRLKIEHIVREKIKEDQEYEFNLSSTEIQLRLVTYTKPGSFKQKKREVIWKSRDWNNLQIILKDFNLSLNFNELITQAKETLKKTRSYNRVFGIFNSMVSIKSGEVGKEKGINKQKALDKVQKLFGES